jgi:hypothetical protein
VEKLYAQNLCTSSQTHAKKQRTTTTPQKHACKSSLLYFLHDSFNVPLLETKTSIKKPMEVTQNHFQMENWQRRSLLHVWHLACFRDILQPPITNSLLFAS